MVCKLEPKDDKFYEDGVNALLGDQSGFICTLDTLDGAEIYKCGVNQNESAMAYWIKYNNLCIAYFIVEPFALPGLFGHIAIRGWVTKSYRGMGLYPQLLRTACSNVSLISGRDGATEDAYNSWLKARGFSYRYYDQSTMAFPNQESVPEDEKFTASPKGRRWLLVLDPE